jgi:hypothetical protein
MRRVRLIHWNAVEAEQRAAGLRAAGYGVECGPLAPPGLRALGRDPPAAVIIDLSRLPSQGRDAALFLRKQASTRRVPLVLAGGDPQKVAGVRKLLPDAEYADWEGVDEAVERAIAHPPAHPVVPRSALDGYAGTPLPQKLGIKAGSRVGLLDAPDDFAATLGELPAGASLRADGGSCDLILWFVRSRQELEERVGATGAAAGAGGLWILWPKKASGVATDLSEPVVRRAGLASGLVDYKVAAIDATWSGLKFTRRKTG